MCFSSPCGLWKNIWGWRTVSLWIFMPVTENMAKQLFAEPLNSYQDLNIYVHIYIYRSQIKYGNY